MSKETRQFRMHPKLLYDVIQRQAGSLAKAILEGVMNAVDAGAKKCVIKLEPEFATIDDDGRGFRSREEIVQFFEVFGQPHEASEKKTFGTFRMGRGQMFAFGENTWETQEFVMYVDIKNKGLEYDLRKQDNKKVRGCNILISLYEPLLPSKIADTEHDLKLWCRWMPIEVVLNGTVISNDPAEFDWTEATPEAYIELDERPALEVYNLGAHVMSIPKYKFGVGGEVVSRQQLQVNFARNDVQSTCPVWKKIVPKVDQHAKDRVTHKKSLDDAQRQRLATLVSRGELPWHELANLPLITAVTGRHYKVWDVGRVPVTVASKGDRQGDRIHRQKLAFVVATETLQRFAVADLKSLFGKFKAAAGNNHLHPWQIVDFEKVTQGMRDRFEVLSENQLRPTEKVWVDLIEIAKFHVRLDDEPDRRQYFGGSPPSYAAERRTVVGLTDSADGWTDAETYIAINRDWLAKQELNAMGFAKVAGLYLHECCHRSPDLEEHDHDQAFYELFHDSSEEFIATFIGKCLANLPQVLERHNRKLTRKQLREQDRIVQGQRRQENLQKIAAKD